MISDQRADGLDAHHWMADAIEMNMKERADRYGEMTGLTSAGDSSVTEPSSGCCVEQMPLLASESSIVVSGHIHI